MDQECPVTQAIISDTWNLPRGRHPILVLLRSCLPMVPILRHDSEADIYMWKTNNSSPPSCFSTTKTWSSLNPCPLLVTWSKSVWFTNHVPKHAFHLWATVQNRLPTRDRLCSWGLNVRDVCLLCGIEPESKKHLFFSCTFSTQVWTAFFSHQALSGGILGMLLSFSP